MLWNPARAEETSLRLSPPPDSEISSRDLVLSASISGPLSEALELGGAKLYLNDRDVTGLCLRTESYLSYRPLTPLQPGVVEARLEFTNGMVRRWQFEVVEVSLIESVTHNAEEALGEYQELQVQIVAAPGERVTFSIADERHEYPTEEVSEGVYEGVYTVMPGDYHLGVPIRAHLYSGEGEEQHDSEKPASLFGHLFRVHIIEPLSGKAPSNNFLIKGRTRPGSKVSLVPRLSLSSNTPAPSSRWDRDGGGSIETRADEDGFFEVEYGVPIALPSLSVVLSVFAVTPEGERSVPITLRYKF